MTETEKQVGSVNLLNVLTEGRELPEGYDAWAIRTVHSDLRSSRGYQYPFPGLVAEAPGPIYPEHDGECPSREGDGICAAHNWRGMASGGVSARTLLLVAYQYADVLGETFDKLRLRRFLVVNIIDGERLLIESGSYADLSSAKLHSANLRYAKLHSANLRYADLSSANLSYANLSYANLSSADLRYANLRYADLSSADLRYADLRSANLRYAKLRSANLSYADLGYADQLDSAYWDRSKWEVTSQGLIAPERRQ